MISPGGWKQSGLSVFLEPQPWGGLNFFSSDETPGDGSRTFCRCSEVDVDAVGSAEPGVCGIWKKNHFFGQC